MAVLLPSSWVRELPPCCPVAHGVATRSLRIQSRAGHFAWSQADSGSSRAGSVSRTLAGRAACLGRIKLPSPPANKCLQLSGTHLTSYTGVVPCGPRTQLPWGGLGGRVPAAEAQVRWAA
jgi:hypothetical protein